jgi:hypothetical protein
VVLINWKNGRTESLDLTTEAGKARAYRISSDTQLQKEITGTGFNAGGRLQMVRTPRTFRERKLWLEAGTDKAGCVLTSKIVYLLDRMELIFTHYHANDMIVTEAKQAGRLRFDRGNHAIFGEKSG